MCVKIVKEEVEITYDARQPIEAQLEGSQKVVVHYDPKDSSIDTFLHEMERLCKNGSFSTLNFEFNYNSNLNGFKAKNKMRTVQRDLEINEIVKLMVLMQSEADKKLDEITKACFGNRI